MRFPKIARDSTLQFFSNHRKEITTGATFVAGMVFNQLMKDRGTLKFLAPAFLIITAATLWAPHIKKTMHNDSAATNDKKETPEQETQTDELNVDTKQCTTSHDDFDHVHDAPPSDSTATTSSEQSMTSEKSSTSSSKSQSTGFWAFLPTFAWGSKAAGSDNNDALKMSK